MCRIATVRALKLEIGIHLPEAHLKRSGGNVVEDYNIDWKAYVLSKNNGVLPGWWTRDE